MQKLNVKSIYTRGKKKKKKRHHRELMRSLSADGFFSQNFQNLDSVYRDTEEVCHDLSKFFRE